MSKSVSQEFVVAVILAFVLMIIGSLGATFNRLFVVYENAFYSGLMCIYGRGTVFLCVLFPAAESECNCEEGLSF